MTWKRILGLTYGECVWLLAGVVLLAYELWAVFTRGGDVLTRAMRANEPRWLAIPFGLGGLMGHLTGPRWPAFPYAWAIPFAILFALLVRDALGGAVSADLRTPLFLVGYIAGVFWVGAP